MASFEVVRASPFVGPSCSTSISSHIHLSGQSRSTVDPNRSIFGEGEEEEEEEGEGDEKMKYEDGAEGNDFETGSNRPTLLATTGQPIASSNTFMRGHGAYLTSDASSVITSALCGVVSRTNRLVSVSALKSRYAPEVGDLVVGRVMDVQAGNRRWKVDVGSRQDAVLALSSVNLPGGIQRRKLESDELQMRNFFGEGDLLVAEVQTAFSDGSVGLHTRSLRYGKLRNGALVLAPPVLIRRLKSHFVQLPQAKLEVTMGLNGFIWVASAGATATSTTTKTTGQGRDVEVGTYSDFNEDVAPEVRRRITRVIQLVSLLAIHHLPISDTALARAYDLSCSLAPVASDGSDEPQCMSEDVIQVIIEEARRAESGFDGEKKTSLDR